MATVIRAELSTKNKYWVDKHRYYELKHFCLQYPDWRRACSEITYIGGQNFGSNDIRGRANVTSDPTFRLVEKRMLYTNRIKLVEQTAMKTDPELVFYILKGVTGGLSYTQLKSKLNIPCSRDTYYDRYRRFFWLLDKNRD